MVEFGKPHGFPADLVRKDDRPPVRAVGDIHGGQVLGRKRLCNEEAHLPAADHEDVPAGERADLRLGELDCG